MNDEALLRLSLFAAAIGMMLIWESLWPFRAFAEGKLRRLARHLGLMLANLLCLRLLSGGGAYAVAEWAARGNLAPGLLRAVDTPAPLAFALGLLLLDFAIYAQHRAFHRIPWLWRIHRVHHSDLDFDTTTALRFHPIEIVLSMFYKMVIVLVLGVEPGCVLVFEALLNACAQFNHGNVRLPVRAEKLLAWLLITPDIHRIHHSSERDETDSNYGFSVPWWDRLLGTYRGRAGRGQSGLELGLAEWPDRKGLTLIRLLALPFVRTARSR